MANNDEILKAIESLKKDMATKSDLEASEKRMTQQISTTEKSLKQAILASQEDTINALKEYIHEAYDMHEKRIGAIEDHLGLSTPE